MSRFGLLKHLQPSPGGSFLVNQTLPTLSGIPRENEAAWIGAGDWSATPNLYRFKTYRDGTLSSATVQSGDALEFVWATADVGHAITVTVEASADNGSTWTLATARLNFAFPSDLITPATIPTPTLTRVTSSGATPMQFSIDGIDLYDSYNIRMLHYNAAGSLLDESYVALSEAALTTPFTIDLSGNVDPAPAPPLTTMAATDVLRVSVVSGDFQLNVSGAPVAGVTSAPAFVSPTNTTGSQYWKINFTAGTQVSAAQIETAISIGGVNNASGKNYTFIPAGAGANAGSNTTFDVLHFFDGNFKASGTTTTGATIGALDINTYGFPAAIVIDYGIPVALHELRISVEHDFSSTFTAFTFGPCDAAGTYSATSVTASGLTWSSTTNTTQAWDF